MELPTQGVLRKRKESRQLRIKSVFCKEFVEQKGFIIIKIYIETMRPFLWCQMIQVLTVIALRSVHRKLYRNPMQLLSKPLKQYN